MDASDWKLVVATAQDIERCYLLILGRAPESTLVLETMLKPTVRDLLIGFLTSAELEYKLFVQNGRLSVEPSFLSVVDPNLISWLESLVPFGAEARQALADLPERLTAMQLLLAHEDIGGSFRATRIGSPSDPYNLADVIGQTLEMAKTVQASELFDEQFYGKQVGADTDTRNYSIHYVLIGEPSNISPSAQFDPSSYVAHNPDLIGLQGNLLCHYELYGRKEGRSLGGENDNYDAHSAQAAVVRNSVLFDEAYYRQQLDPAAKVVDAALHYLIEGEQLGLRASAAFDAKTYSELHPDIGSSSINRLLHFEMHGRAEKRSYRWAVDDLSLATDRIDPAKQTVIVLMHQASHTGAPILGWNIGKMLLEQYNVVVLFGTGGTLEDAVHETFSAAIGPMPSEYAYMLSHHARLAERIKKVYNPIYVVANSAETRWQGTALRSVGIPIIALVHEFTGTLPDNINRPFFPLSSTIVFPAEVVREDEERAYREIGLQNIAVIPQGPSAVPPFAVVRGAKHAPIMPRIGGAAEPKVGDVDALFGGKCGEGTFTVVGMGAVELRKGVDFFIAAAKALAVRNPSLDFRFVWVGSWDHAVGTPHGKLLEEQIFRSQLGDKLQLVPAVEDIEKIYARADVLFLSSRLDPLPNVSIDAALREVPVLCFQEASGMAELLIAHPETRDLVLPHMDIGAVADRLAELIADPALCRRLGQAVGTVGRATFDMKRYVESIDRLGLAAYRKALHAHSERDFIVAAKVFEPAIYFESGDGFEKSEADNATVSEYLDRTRQINFANDPVWGVFPRRPAAGFHPFIYGQSARDFPPGGERDPLAHWVEAGQPEGPWKHPVIRIAEANSLQNETRSADSHAPAKVALHGHFHYTDNIDDFLEALRANRSRMDLFLTTNSEASAEELARATSSYQGGLVAIDVGENYGRDIAPFIGLLETRIVGHYDIVGHVHGKRSLHAKAVGVSEDLGSRWREFLWQHLIGPDYPAADILLNAMIDDPTIGLLFPETDLIVGWEKNFEGAKALAGRMGIVLPLPHHIEFPVGTMFWARPEALRALIDARFAKEDYPQEPLPIDGTMLHVMERFLPMVCEAAGYRYATSYIPHIRR